MSEQPLTKWQKFKRFLKRNMTPTWFKHISYQIFAFLVSVAMVIGVAEYAVTKTYDGLPLVIVDGFTVTAHIGAFNATLSAEDFVKNSVEDGVKSIELDIRQRPDGTVVVAPDIVVTNRDGLEFERALDMLKDTDINIFLEIKEIKSLNQMHELLVEYKMVDRCCMTGIEKKDVSAVKESDCKDIPYYLNYSPSRTKIFMEEYRQKILDILTESGAIGLNCNFNYVGSSLSELLHSNGYKLSVWTVDTELEAKKMLIVQPDNIMTKDVNMVGEVIADWGK